MVCYCRGDIDDCEFGESEPLCEHCPDEDDEELPDDHFPDDFGTPDYLR